MMRTVSTLAIAFALGSTAMAAQAQPAEGPSAPPTEPPVDGPAEPLSGPDPVPPEPAPPPPAPEDKDPLNPGEPDELDEDDDGLPEDVDPDDDGDGIPDEEEDPLEPEPGPLE